MNYAIWFTGSIMLIVGTLLFTMAHFGVFPAFFPQLGTVLVSVAIGTYTYAVAGPKPWLILGVVAVVGGFLFAVQTLNLFGLQGAL